MNNIHHYDFIVIGGGPAGQGAAEVAAISGRKTLVIERNVLGGVVATTGGAPTKTLRDAALYLTGFHDRDVYGLTGQIDSALVGKCLRSERRLFFHAGKHTQLPEKRGIDVIYGTAQLGREHTVLVTNRDHNEPEQIFSADRILLATGSYPFRPVNISFEYPNVYDSENLLTIPALPKSALRRWRRCDRV